MNDIIKYLIIYIVIINLIAFLAMYLDKRKARYGKWRIPEQTLFVLALIGGSIGAIAGMYTFRHKTKKLRFSIGFPVILVMQIILIFMVYNDFIKWKMGSNPFFLIYYLKHYYFYSNVFCCLLVLKNK